jgi:urease accessory protein
LISKINLLKTLQISDSAFPSGSFAFSGGLEALTKDLENFSSQDLLFILENQIIPRWFEFDRFFLRNAHSCSGNIKELMALDRKCHVQNTNGGLAIASRRVGRSLISVHKSMETPFVSDFSEEIAAKSKPGTWGYEPVVRGLIGFGLDIDIEMVEVGAVYGALYSVLSSGVRLNVVGSIKAQEIMASLIPTIDYKLSEELPKMATTSALLADIAVSRRSMFEVSLFSN